MAPSQSLRKENKLVHDWIEYERQYYKRFEGEEVDYAKSGQYKNYWKMQDLFWLFPEVDQDIDEAVI